MTDKDIGIYARVSQPDQDIETQKENLWTYAVDTCGFDPKRIEVYDDHGITGTTTARDEYRRFMDDIRNDTLEIIVCRTVSRLGRSMMQIFNNVQEIVEERDLGLYAMNDNIEKPPGEEMESDEKLRIILLGWAAEKEIERYRENSLAGVRAAEAAGKWTHRPPYGFTTDDDGYLAPNENFHKAMNVILADQEYDWSQRKIARHTGVPRRTVPSILERRDLYLAEQPSDTDYDAPREAEP